MRDQAIKPKRRMTPAEKLDRERAWNTLAFAILVAVLIVWARPPCS